MIVKKRVRLRAVLGAMTVAMLTVAMLAPAGPASAGNGHGNGNGNGQGQAKDHGHGNGQAKTKDHGQGNGQDKPKDNAHGSNEHAAAQASTKDKNKGHSDAEDETTDTGTSPDIEVQDESSSNHDVMEACKKGGWQGLQREDGTRFSNQGRCVSYAVHGGLIAAVVPAVTISFVVSADLLSCDATATIADFDPATLYGGTLLVNGVDPLLPPVSFTTDALGDALVPLGTFTPLVTTLNLAVDGVSSGDVVVDCTEVPEVPVLPIP
jgi:hypothetical protein